MILSLAIWMPIIFGLVILGSGSDGNRSYVRWMALFAALLSFVITIPLITDFDATVIGMQFVENLPWVARYDLNYHLGVDGISVWLVVLTSFITVIVVLAGWEVIQDRVAQYMAAFLILSGIMIGVFAALDGLLF